MGTKRFRPGRKHRTGGRIAPAQRSVQTRSLTQRPAFRITLIVLLVIVTAATYANSLSGVFVFDDITAIVDNVHIRNFSRFTELIGAQLDTPVKGRPIVGLSLIINYALGRLQTGGYHIFNIAVHILCGLVLFAIVRRTLLSKSLSGRFGKVSENLAFVCVLLWMIHPIQTDTVTYIIQRTESIMALFYLLTLYCAIRSFGSAHRLGWYAASVVSCVLGALSKEVIVTAPLIVLLYDRTFESGSFALALRRRWPLYAALAAAWAVLAAMMYLFPRSITVGFSVGVGPFEYALNQCVMITNYLKLIFWPHRLVLDYGVPGPLSISRVLPQAAILLTLLALTIAALIYRPSLGFVGAWFFIILGPTSSFLPITSEVGAERRMYLPAAAVVALVVTAGYNLLGRAGRRLRAIRTTPSGRFVNNFEACIGTVLVISAAAALALLTTRRNRDYRSELLIWQKSVEAVPDNARGHNNVGLALKSRRRLDEAVAAYRRALDYQSDYVDAHNNLGIVMAMKGRLDEAVGHCEKAVALDAAYAKGYNNLGIIRAMQGKFDEAVDYCLEAIRIRPDYPQAHNNLGNALASQHKFSEAVISFNRALELKPDYVEAHCNLANSLKALGKIDEAINHYRRALELNADHQGSLNNLARLLARHPDPRHRSTAEAVALAERSAVLTEHKNPAILATLADCYAAAGRFDRAAKITGAALKLAAADGKEQLTAQLSKQLQKYKNSMP